MIENLACFKCHEHFATLTYCENRMYRVSCPCGCSYTFEHSSMETAEKHHLREVELHGEIDAHRRTKAKLAAPVVHGEWVSKPHAAVIVCSECKEPYCHAKKYTYNYCPNCGAKMDKEET